MTTEKIISGSEKKTVKEGDVTFLSLSDSAEISGVDFDEFAGAVKGVSSQTHCTEVKADEIPYAISYAKAYDDYLHTQEDNPNKMPFHVLSKESLEKVAQTGGKIQTGYVLLDKLPSKPLIDENISGNRLMIKLNDKFVPLSDYALGSAFERAGLGGPGMYTNDLIRNELLISRLYDTTRKLKFIWREDPETGDQKIFGAMSWKYKYIPQSMILDVYERMRVGSDFSHPVSKGWSIGHLVTRIYSEYPDEEKDGLIPGIELRDSDTGNSSFTVYATMRRKGAKSYVIVGEVSHIHMGEKVEDLLDEIDKNIYPELRLFPKLMKELEAPVSSALLSEDDKKKQMSLIEDIYRKLFKGFKSGISAKRKKDLRQALIDEIDPDREYTWRDIAEQLMSVPDRVIGIDTESTVFCAFRKELGKVPFILSDMKDKKGDYKEEAQDDDTELILA